MTDNWKTDYAQRQYRLIDDQLALFEDGKLGLGALIKSIKALLSILEEIDEVWVGQARGEWGTLEVVYAVALDRKEQGLAPDVQTTINDPIQQALIKEGVLNIRRLVRDRIEEVGD